MTVYTFLHDTQFVESNIDLETALLRRDGSLLRAVYVDTIQDDVAFLNTLAGSLLDWTESTLLKSMTLYLSLAQDFTLLSPDIWPSSSQFDNHTGCFGFEPTVLTTISP